MVYTVFAAFNKQRPFSAYTNVRMKKHYFPPIFVFRPFGKCQNVNLMEELKKKRGQTTFLVGKKKKA